MSAQCVDQFLDAIKPFAELIDALYLVCAATVVKEKWVALYTGIFACNSGWTRLPEKYVTEIPEFLFVSVSRPLAEVRQILEALLQAGTLDLQVGEGQVKVFMNTWHAGLDPNNRNAVSLNPPYMVKPNCDEKKSAKSPSIVLRGYGTERVWALGGSDRINAISSQLRRKTEYSDLAALLGQFKEKPQIGASDHTEIIVSAELPFEMEAEADRMAITAPSSAFEKLHLVGFFDTNERVKTLIPIPSADSIAKSSFVPDWPNDATKIETFVYFGDQELGCVRAWRYAGTGNWKFVLDSFFDPEQKHLATALRTRNQQEDFEQAVPRLLTLLGFTTILYSKNREKGRPDFVAWNSGSGPPKILLGECTLEKPLQKLSPLKGRRAELEKALPPNAEFVAAVFTAADPAGHDYESAAAEGIRLIGSKELEKLFSNSKRWTFEEAWEYLSTIPISSILVSSFSGSLEI